MITKKSKKGLKVGKKDKGSKTPTYLPIPPTGDTKKAKKQKPEKIDGLNPDDLKRLHKAVRQVWSWSHPWRLVKKRCVGDDGFPRCENPKCKKRGKPVPKIFVDHIESVGKVGGPRYIQRMFIPSSKLQGLCKQCHDKKTKREKEQAMGMF